MGLRDTVSKKIIGGLDAIDGFNADKRIMNHVAKGYTAPKQKSADSDGFFSKALDKAKRTSVGEKLTANVGYKTTTQSVGDDTMDILGNKVLMGKNEEVIKAQKALEGLTEGTDAFAKADEAYKKKLEEVGRLQGVLDNGGFQRGYTPIEYAKDYYGHSEYGKFRRNATIGAIGVVGVGGRLMSGGTLTRNGDGERDIIGVPFI